MAEQPIQQTWVVQTPHETVRRSGDAVPYAYQGNATLWVTTAPEGSAVFVTTTEDIAEPVGTVTFIAAGTGSEEVARSTHTLAFHSDFGFADSEQLTPLLRAAAQQARQRESAPAHPPVAGPAARPTVDGAARKLTSS